MANKSVLKSNLKTKRICLECGCVVKDNRAFKCPRCSKFLDNVLFCLFKDKEFQQIAGYGRIAKADFDELYNNKIEHLDKNQPN